MEYVTAADMLVFGKSFPAAHAFLVGASLRGEYACLARRNSNNLLNDWEKNRLKELADHFSR